MHFDWTFRNGRKTRIAESLIPCGFLGHASLFYADNVHARFAESREAVDGHARFSFARNRENKSALFLPLIAANSGFRVPSLDALLRCCIFRALSSFRGTYVRDCRRPLIAARFA